MLVYILIGLSLSLTGLAIMQFLYLLYLERMEKAHKQRIKELENHGKYLTHRLHDAEQQINDQTEMLEVFYEELEEEEVWADVIEER